MLIGGSTGVVNATFTLVNTITTDCHFGVAQRTGACMGMILLGPDHTILGQNIFVVLKYIDVYMHPA